MFVAISNLGVRLIGGEKETTEDCRLEPENARSLPGRIRPLEEHRCSISELLCGAPPFCLRAPRASAQNVVADWDTIASTTIVSNAGQPPGAAAIWFAYASIAVYDAVNAVHHHPFQPFYYRGFARGEASDQAAAAAAAHRVLVHYFPDQETSLNAQFNRSLNAIAADRRAKAEGVEVGEAAAAELIEERRADGLEADVPYTPGSGPGVWQPTAPKFPARPDSLAGQNAPVHDAQRGSVSAGGPDAALERRVGR